MVTGEWNFLAGRLTGDGSIDIVETELPINVQAINRNLSSPSTMDGTITNTVKRLKVAGKPIFQPWNTVLIAEASGLIRGMTVYRKPTFDGPTWTLDQIGLPGYALGMPYTEERTYAGADPLDMFRDIWAHLQSQPNGNLGITIDDLQSPVRVGAPSPQNAKLIAKREAAELIRDRLRTSEPIFEDWSWAGMPTVVGGWNDELGNEYTGNPLDRPAAAAWLDQWLQSHPVPSDAETEPRKLDWWSTLDLGRTIDDLAREAPFDWVEKFSWQGDQPHCHLGLGYPTIGGRKDHLRLVLGENLADEPSVSEAEWVNQTYVLGSGEGRARVRGYAGTADGRLRRVRVIDDKGKGSLEQANARAREELSALRGQFTVDTLEVFDHPNAPLEAIELGDEIPLYAEMDWATVDDYVRVVGKSESPVKSDVAILTVVRTVTV